MLKKIDWKRPEIITTIVSFVLGIAIHLFGLVNELHNYDDIANQPIGHGSTVSSGRWSLMLFGQAVRLIFGEYNLPWINGLLFILLIAITAGIMISAFDIKKTSSAILFGLVFVSFPSAAATLLFTFTVIYDAFAILLSALAVWLTRKYKYGFIPAAFCIAFSMGIYQAYVPLTISMFVLLLIKQLLQEDVKAARIIWRGLCDCGTIILGLLLYFLFLKFFLVVLHITLDTYQGISDMGKISLAQMPSLIWTAFRGFCTFPFTGYASIAQTAVLKAAYVVLCPVSLLILICIAFLKKKKTSQIILLAALCFTLPIAINFIAVMCPDSTIYTLMVYAFALVPCVPLILLETFPKAKDCTKKLQQILTTVSAAVVVMIILSNAYMANANYSSAYYATRQTENYLTSLVTQVRMTEGFTPEKKWVALGKINDPLLHGPWDDVPIYGGNADSIKLLRKYSWQNWISMYYGYALPWAEDSEVALLNNNEAVRDMPVWPSEGSIKVVDDYVVIKFETLPNS